MNDLKYFGIRLGILMLLTPIGGLVIFKCAQDFEKAWKTKNKTKIWGASCVVFALLAGLGGWLR